MQADSDRLTFGPQFREIEVGRILRLRPEGGFRFDCGAEVAEVSLAYQTYGMLNAEKSNAILVCHGLTGDQYAASPHPVTGKGGWWEGLIGAGKPIDTNKYFVVASNVIGGCMGSLGPKSTNPVTGKPYGLNFPVVTIGDMVRAQLLLADALGVAQWFSVIGGSMGGMQALEWAVRYPQRVFSAIPLATSVRHAAQNIAFHEIGRQAIMADPDWCGGDYIGQGRFPAKGLSVARMTAHVTYLSETVLQHRFGRRLQNREAVGFGFDADFQVESYLRHQGQSFVERFDANAYLYITRAMDYFDLEAEFAGQLAQAFRQSPVRFCIVSFSSDWCFTTAESRHIVRALNAAAANVSFAEIMTDKGHDAFLLDVPEFHATIAGFIAGAAEARGLASTKQ